MAVAQIVNVLVPVPGYMYRYVQINEICVHVPLHDIYYRTVRTHVECSTCTPHTTYMYTGTCM